MAKRGPDGVSRTSGPTAGGDPERLRGEKAIAGKWFLVYHMPSNFDLRSP